MKLAIMQPYFFPYIGYFSLIKRSDMFILFDTPQFIRHGWIERNRILKPNGEPLYIKIPLKKHSREAKINELVVNNSEKWKEKILAQIIPYKKKAPFYREVIILLKEIFEFESDSIVEINHYSLKKVCEYLNIATPIKIWSKMNIDIEHVNAPDEWALNICNALHADTYYNPIGGKSFFDTSKYEKLGINIEFQQMIPVAYKHLSEDFIPFLSIIDVLMFNTVADINKMLGSYELV